MAFGCSFLAPSSDMHASALRAFESSVFALSRGDIETTMTDGSDAEYEQSVVKVIAAPPAKRVRATPRPTLPVKTSDKIEQALAKALEPEVIAEYTCSFCGEKVDV